MPPSVQQIPLERLLVDLQNPRYDPRTSQREALATIAQDQGNKLLNLAEDIAEKGLNPSELAIVTSSGERNTYSVLEGNRRVAALKLLSSPSLVASLGLSQTLVRKYQALYESSKSSLPTELNCVILSREDANYWIMLKHTGENEGVGIVMWDGRSRHRFRGSSPALQAVELVESANYLDNETREKLPKIAITNIERVLNTKEARKLLGVDVKGNHLTLVEPAEIALGRLARFVYDVAHRNVRVSALDTKDQRVSYATKLASQPGLKPLGKDGGKAGAASTASGGTKAGRRIPLHRNTLIPRRLKLVIPQRRINKIYDELQRLHIDQYANSAAVVFRVFIELSADHFGGNHGLSFKVTTTDKHGGTRTRDSSLREKLKDVIKYMEDNSICTKSELRGIRTLVSNSDHVLSVDSLNSYVHNKDYNPSPEELKTNWDNIEVFVQRMWA